jgi:hypothetical protein
MTLFLAQSGCAQKPGETSFHSVSESDRPSQVFSRLSVEEQINTYIYSQYEVEGGRDSFLRYMVSDGEAKLPALLQRIQISSDRDPRDRVALLTAVDLIDQECKCLQESELQLLEHSELEPGDSDNNGVREFKLLYIRLLRDIKARHAPSRD